MIRPFFPRFCLFALLATGCARPATATAGPPADRAADAAIQQRLQTTVVDSDYDGVDFVKVLDDVRKRHGINLLPNWPAFESAGVERNRRIELHLKQVSLATLLDNILLNVTSETELAWMVIDGIVIVSTKEDLARRSETRLYDVSDLLGSQFELRRFSNTPILRLTLAGGGKGGGGLFGGGAGMLEPRAEAVEFVDVNRLIELVESTVDPESWRDAGGNVGSIRSYGNSLLVTQTLSAHEQIAALFKLLRSNRAMPLVADAYIVSRSAADVAKWKQAVGASFPRLNGEQVRAATAGEGARVVFRGTSSGSNGRRFWFSSLTQRMVVASYSPVLGDGVWAVNPEIVAVNHGLELIALPLVSADDNSLSLDVQMAWSPKVDVRDKPVTLGPAVVSPVAGSGSPSAVASGPAVGTIELTSRHMRTVSTTVRMPLGEAVALSIPGDDGGEHEDWLILHVRRAGP